MDPENVAVTLASLEECMVSYEVDMRLGIVISDIAGREREHKEYICTGTGYSAGCQTGDSTILRMQ